MSRHSLLLSLSIREYRTFLFGFFVSQMGAQMQAVAISWQIYQMTHSAVVLGLVGAVSFVPLMLLSPFGGVAADHFNRKKLLIGTQIILALAAILLATATVLHLDSVIVIFALLALEFAAMAFFGPVRQAVIPELVPKEYLLNAISVHIMARQSAVIIGPAIAGLLIALYGVAGIYVLNSIALVVMIATLLPLRIPEHTHRETTWPTLSSFMDGFRFIGGSPIILSTALLDFFATFFGSATSLLPIFALDILHVDARGLGLLYAATSAGAVAAGMVISGRKKILHQGRIIVTAVFFYGVATLAFGFSRSLYLSLILLAAAGAADMVSTILRNNIRQTLTPSGMRGRMTGINLLFAQGGPKLGDTEAGLLAAATSAPFSVVVGGIGTMLTAGIVAYAVPRLRKFKGDQLTI